MADDPIAFDCPRCAAAATERFYGPCAQCREILKSTIKGVAAASEATEYEPKMNVTPNAVASKE